MGFDNIDDITFPNPDEDFDENTICVMFVHVDSISYKVMRASMKTCTETAQSIMNHYKKISKEERLSGYVKISAANCCPKCSETFSGIILIPASRRPLITIEVETDASEHLPEGAIGQEDDRLL